MSTTKQRYRSRGHTMPLERREVTVPATVKEGPKDTAIIEGEFIVYNTPYFVNDSLGQFSETMHPGVLNAPCDKSDVRMLLNHNGLPLARTTIDPDKPGYLGLKSTPTGESFRAVVDLRMAESNSLAVCLDNGTITQMSCGFSVARDKWNADYTVRDIYGLKQLVDVSPVTYPASPTTSVAIATRALLNMPEEEQFRMMRFLGNMKVELCTGKQISKTNAQKLATILDHITKAGGHVQDLLDLGDNDGTVAGGGNGQNGTDAAGTRAHKPIDSSKVSPAARRDADALNLEAEHDADVYTAQVVKELRAELAREDRELERIVEAAEKRQQLERDLKR